MMRWRRRWPALYLLPTFALATSASAALRPITERPYHYTTVETRSTNGVTRRFETRRTVVFRRNADGFSAIVTLDAVDQRADDDVARMFSAATMALLHQPVRLQLDHHGAVVAVDDADALVARIGDAIERMAASAGPRAGASSALGGPLRALPIDRKIAMLASILTPLLAGPLADRLPGSAPITLASRPPLPRGTNLTGTETTTRSADGLITVETIATGSVAATSSLAPSAAPAARATVTIARTLDSATGLIVHSREATDATLGDGTTTQRLQTITTITVATPSD